MEKIKTFNKVLELLSEPDIRNFTEALLNDADEYFFTEPSSSTGKYHPEYALGEGGLARHSIAVALILSDILNDDCYEFSLRQKQLLIASAIVHDIKKYGEGKKHTVKNHPELAAQYIIQEQTNNRLISSSDAEFMASSVLTHMGKWGAEKPSTDAQKLVHIADCLAAKKWLNVDFNMFQEQSYGPLFDKEEPAGEYVITFGKYNGSKLKDIDDGYLDFLVNKFGGKTHPVVKKAKLVLEERTKKDK